MITLISIVGTVAVGALNAAAAARPTSLSRTFPTSGRIGRQHGPNQPKSCVHPASGPTGYRGRLASPFWPRSVRPTATVGAPCPGAWGRVTFFSLLPRRLASRAREEKRRREEEARQVEIAEVCQVIETWNAKLAAGRRILSAPTFGAARLAGYRWLTVYCPGCGTVKEIDLAKIDRHPDASITSRIADLSCRMCRPHAPFAQLRRLTRDRMLEAARHGDRLNLRNTSQPEGCCFEGIAQPGVQPSNERLLSLSPPACSGGRGFATFRLLCLAYHVPLRSIPNRPIAIGESPPSRRSKSSTR